MRPALVALPVALALVAAAAVAIDGDLDPSFGSTGQSVFGIGLGPAYARAAAVTDAGLMVTGDDEASAGNFDFLVVRLNPEGSVSDTSAPIAFDAVAGGDDLARAIAGAPGGKVVVAGSVEEVGTTYLGVARLIGSTLALDSSFGGASGRVVLGFGGLEFSLPAVAVLADGSILVGCTFGNPAVFDRDFGIFKLAPDGSLDQSFGSGGFTSVAFDLGADHVDIFRALAVQPDGKIVLAGSAQWGATDYDFAVARLLPNGDPDTGFGPFGTGRLFVAFDLDSNATDQAASVALAADGRIAVAGRASQTPVPWGAIAMLLPNGGLDSSFDGDGRQEVAWIGNVGVNEVTAAAFESDGTLFLSGDAWWQLGAQGNLGVARLLRSGAYDFTFRGGFHMYDLDAGWEYSQSAILDGGRPLLVGTREGDWAIVRLTNALVFRDGFENGSTSAWSRTGS